MNYQQKIRIYRYQLIPFNSDFKPALAWRRILTEKKTGKRKKRKFEEGKKCKEYQRKNIEKDI